MVHPESKLREKGLLKMLDVLNKRTQLTFLRWNGDTVASFQSIGAFYDVMEKRRQMSWVSPLMDYDIPTYVYGYASGKAVDNIRVKKIIGFVIDHGLQSTYNKMIESLMWRSQLVSKE